MRRSFFITLAFAVAISSPSAFAASSALGGGCLPGTDCAKEEAAPAMEEPAPVPVAKECGWGARISAGAPIYLFQEEDDAVGGGVYFDAFPCDLPINLRVGAEVNHMNADQPNALSAAEAPGRVANLTFVRIPFAIEYTREVANNTHFFAGLGPDIIHTANDIGDTGVGFHLSARLLHNFTDSWGVALEAGYMWGEVESSTGDVDLDNTFIIPTLSYTF